MTKATARWRKWPAISSQLGLGEKDFCPRSRHRGGGCADLVARTREPGHAGRAGVDPKASPYSAAYDTAGIARATGRGSAGVLEYGTDCGWLCASWGCPLKKPSTRTSRESEPAQVWREAIAELEVEQLIFLDGSGATTQMTRGHARAPRGQRSKNHAAGPRCPASSAPGVSFV